jgi:PAS domain S-box-containing protein
MEHAPVPPANVQSEVRRILDAAAIGLTHCSRDLRYLACNRAYEQLVGISAEQIIGRPMIDVLGAKAFEEIRPYIERVLRGERVEFEVEVPISSGEPRFFHVVDEPWFDSEGLVTGWIASVSEITDLKRTTKALGESEERLRLAMSSGTIGVWDWEERSGQLTASPEIGRIYGLDVKDLRTFEDFAARVHPDDLAKVESVSDTAIRNQQPFDTEFRIVRPSGEIRWIAARGQAYYDKNGQLVRMVANNIDITERVQINEALRESKEREAFLLRLADTLQPLSDPLAIQEVSCRLLGEHLLVNRVRYTDIEGTDYIVRMSYVNGVAPLVGRGPVAAFGEWLLEAHKSTEPIIVNDVCTDPRFTESERAYLRANEIAAFASVMLVKGKQWVAGFGVHSATPRVWAKIEVELIREVADRVWEAVERARAEAALREREQRLRLALDASAGGSWTWDIGPNHVDWDDRFRKLYGFGPKELPTFDAWFSRVHEEDRQRVLGLQDEILHTNKADGWDHTFRIVRPDGTVLWTESLGLAQRDADGQVIRLTGLELDITERRRAEEVLQARHDEERERVLQIEAEEALRRSHAELEQSHAELERSHAELEQRTLQLSRLASQLTLAEQSARRQLASTLHDGLQQLLFSAGITLDEAMKTNSQDDQVELLQRARADMKEAMEAARTLSVNLFPPVLHLGGLPAALTWLARRTQEQYGIVVNVTADPQANPTASDVRILLFEAVRELLFNAVKHADIDRVDVNLAIGTGDTIHIQVSDEGVGFDPAATPHDKDQAQSGLGLFSIQERLALVGGKLDIDSAPGKGSRFTLSLPRTLQGSDRTEVQRRDTAWQERLVYDSASDRWKFLRILIADDHAIARAGLRDLLGKRREFQVIGEAGSGVEAIKQAVALQPDVIILDVSLPQMNGIDATREIHSTMRHIRIVGLSTHDDESTERLMRKAGAEAYFTKNEGTDRLLDYLLSLLEKAKGASTG